MPESWPLALAVFVAGTLPIASVLVLIIGSAVRRGHRQAEAARQARAAVPPPPPPPPWWMDPSL